MVFSRSRSWSSSCPPSSSATTSCRVVSGTRSWSPARVLYVGAGWTCSSRLDRAQRLFGLGVEGREIAATATRQTVLALAVVSERRPARMVQVRELRGRHAQWGARHRRWRRPDLDATCCRSASRLHLPLAQLPRRHLSRDARHLSSPIDFALYITFFPLVADRSSASSDPRPARAAGRIDRDLRVRGPLLHAWARSLIADTVAPVADAAFAVPPASSRPPPP